jgi:hypothetical protein
MAAFSVWFFAAQAVISVLGSAAAAAGLISAETLATLLKIIQVTLPIPATTLALAHQQTEKKAEAAMALAVNPADLIAKETVHSFLSTTPPLASSGQKYESTREHDARARR